MWPAVMIRDLHSQCMYSIRYHPEHSSILANAALIVRGKVTRQSPARQNSVTYCSESRRGSPSGRGIKLTLTGSGSGSCDGVHRHGNGGLMLV